MRTEEYPGFVFWQNHPSREEEKNKKQCLMKLLVRVYCVSVRLSVWLRVCVRVLHYLCMCVSNSGTDAFVWVPVPYWICVPRDEARVYLSWFVCVCICVALLLWTLCGRASWSYLQFSISLSIQSVCTVASGHTKKSRAFFTQDQINSRR